MIKPASSLCNLSCEYCFYRDVSEHREHLGFGVMKKSTARVLIEKALDYSMNARKNDANIFSLNLIEVVCMDNIKRFSFCAQKDSFLSDNIYA